MSKDSNIIDLQKKVAKFRDDRDWKQFHTPKDLAMSVAIEAAELMECFQWKSKEDIENYICKNESIKITEEMADVLIYLLNLADILNIDIAQALIDKLDKNDKKYPVEKAKGKSTKYNKL